ncbi:MAG: hypothetical protein B7Y17_02245 [Sulfuricurvum sp. 24-42-5]|nr:MAG: hypothetical protein B7Y17_02245 [Sulfuricurvum sp. 24-42-5]
MNRRGFTLIELLISVILFGLIATFMYGAIDQMRHAQRFYEKKQRALMENEKTRSLLYDDLIHAKKVTITGNHPYYNVVAIDETQHALYGGDLVNVIWLVLKESNRLIRLESVNPLALPIDPSLLYGIHVNEIVQGCKTFRVYESEKGYLAGIFSSGMSIMVEAPK